MKFYILTLSAFFLACGQNQHRPNQPNIPSEKTVEITQIEDKEIRAQSSDASASPSSHQEYISVGDFEVQNLFLLAAKNEIIAQEDIEMNNVKDITMTHVADEESDVEEQMPLLIKSYMQKHENFDQFIGKRNKNQFKNTTPKNTLYQCLEKTLECSLEGNCSEEENENIKICTYPVQVVHLQMSFQYEEETEMCFLIDGLISGDDLIYMHTLSTRLAIECLSKIEVEEHKSEQNLDEKNDGSTDEIKISL